MWTNLVSNDSPFIIVTLHVFKHHRKSLKRHEFGEKLFNYATYFHFILAKTLNGEAQQDFS